MPVTFIARNKQLVSLKENKVVFFADKLFSVKEVAQAAMMPFLGLTNIRPKLLAYREILFLRFICCSRPRHIFKLSHSTTTASVTFTECFSFPRCIVHLLHGPKNLVLFSFVAHCRIEAVEPLSNIFNSGAFEHFQEWATAVPPPTWPTAAEAVKGMQVTCLSAHPLLPWRETFE